MSKFIIITLTCVIVLLSFAFCFADSAYPVILPVSDSPSTSGYTVKIDDNTSWNFSSDSSPVYIAFYENDLGTKFMLFFSDNPNNHVYQYSSYSGSSFTYSLNSEYNGYYYSNTNGSIPDDVILGVFSGPAAIIDYVDNSVFSTTFDLTYLIDGSVNWISSMAQAVKDNGLLLFFVLFIIVGVGIGLFKRFTN